jgi:hypothetical protein
MLIQCAAALCLTAALAGPPPQAYQARHARRHFIAVYFERQFVQGNGFAKHPLEDVLGQEVNEVHLESFQYRTHDGQTLVNVDEFGRRAAGVGAFIYPFGSSEGATLAIKGSIDTIPNVRVSFTGPAPVGTYALTNGRAYDVGVGIDMSDRSPGWGLGSHAYLVGGTGRAVTDQANGTRYFAEGGGGVMFGPLGFDIAFKYVVNRFSVPVSNSVAMIPVSVRGTVSF